MTRSDEDPARNARSTRDRRLSRRRLLATGVALGVGAIAGCLGGDDGGDDATTTGAMDSMETDTMDGMGTETMDSMGTDIMSGDGSDDGMDTETAMGTAESGMDAAWRTTDLTDVSNGETFTIGGFDGTVVLETFAVWCPTCTRQQKQLRGIAAGMDAVAVVSLNVDPNEDAEKVRKHAEENGFGWYYAVAPTDVTKSLTDAFGSTVLNAPSAPVIVVCPDGSATVLEGRGVKSTTTIENALADC
jgi:hypothetical protein